MSPLLDIDEFYAELEKEGEDQVRKNLATERIYGSTKRPLVEEWLRRKDQEREDSLNREQIKIAREAASEAASAASEAARAAESSAKSARDTARETRKANKLATMAIIIAAGSMIVVIIKALLD